MFCKMDLVPSSGEGRETPVQLGPLRTNFILLYYEELW
jgi:hypothetical protein